MNLDSTNDENHYADLISRQVDQYKETEAMHDLSPIFEYWSSKHNREKSTTVIGQSDIFDFYADYFQRSLHETGYPFLISIGSGDSSIEIEIVKRLIAKKVKHFFFICLELSPLLVERARKKIDAEGLGDIITVSQTDLNKWQPKYSFAAVMAHHALHHILDLEHLFNLVKNNLAPGGRFITADMIGRNGHMRWPEALAIIRAIWEKLPRKYKFHHQFRKFDDYYDNWDCSTEGFEGIRAEDILPLLIKLFSFEIFYGYGNLIDPFIDRGFGPNFKPDLPKDRIFIDWIEALNDELISSGILKPTAMIAVMKNEKIVSPRYYKNRTPEFSLRDPLSSPQQFYADKINNAILDHTATFSNEEMTPGKPFYELSTRLNFKGTNSVQADSISGIPYLGYGWCTPDPDWVWTSCEDASLLLLLKHPIQRDLEAEFSFLLYQSPLYKNTTVEILANNIAVNTVNYNNETQQGVVVINFKIPAPAMAGTNKLQIRFILPNRRQPQYESGPDLRALGIGLLTARLF